MLKQISKEHDLIVDDERTSNTVAALKQGILDNLFYVVGKRAEVATDVDYFMALAYTVRDRILARWLTTKEDYAKHNVRTVYYLSAEFLMGPYLANNVLNLGIDDVIRQAAAELDLDLSHLIGQESEPGLGNGGLGRLAADRAVLVARDRLAVFEVERPDDRRPGQIGVYRVPRGSPGASLAERTAVREAGRG